MNDSSELDLSAFDDVRFEQSDLHGLSRSKTVGVNHFERFAAGGLNFFGGLLGLDLQGDVPPGTGYMDERHFADQLLMADRSTFAPVPWATRTARIIGEPHWYGGEPAAAAPRYLMRRMLDELQSMGYTLSSGFEYEFYVVDAESRQPVFPGIQIFWTLRNNFEPEFVSFLLDSLRGIGIDVITSNAEYGPGQMEINYAPKEGIKAADDAFTFKNAVKEIAQNMGYMASFMTKPYADQSASGCHFHHSLLSWQDGTNAFHDAAAEGGLSELGRFWIGGQLAHAAAVSALLAPTINCAKRFKLFSFAPMNATWGFEDRTTAIRVKGGDGGQMHIENRIPGAASNPYLVGAAVLAAGIDGVRRRLEPPPPTETIAYLDDGAPKLPQRLEDALAALEQDEVLCGALGEEFIKLFLAVKRYELDKAQKAMPEYESPDWPIIVTDWERQNLFEYL